MSIEINFPDKILAGVNQSYTVTTDEGAPSGQVQVEGKDLPHRVVPLGAPKDALVSTTPVMKYKVSFFLPDGTQGKDLVMRFRAGASQVEEKKPITDS
jgi:hypothetical protein